MTYIMALFLLGLVVGLVGVASNPSPYFGALGLVVVAGMGCGVLLEHGGPFLSLVLFLIYLGGMLVVFAYSAALAADPFPKSWGSRSVLPHTVLHVLGVGAVASMVWVGWYEMSLVPVDEVATWSVSQGDTGGVALLYLMGGSMLFLGAWVLLLTLIVVLEVTRGLGRGVLRAV